MNTETVNTLSNAKAIFASLPRDWLVTCIIRTWASAEYSVNIEKRKTTWKMGVPIAGKPSPSLKWQTWRVFFAILTFLTDTNTTVIGYRELCRRMNLEVSGQMLDSIRTDLRLLHDYWIKRETNNNVLVFSLLEKVSFSKPSKSNKSNAYWNFEVSIADEFRRLISGNEGRQLRFDQLCGIRSEIVGCLYLFLPSWAYHYKTQTTPLIITLKTIGKLLDKQNAATSVIYKTLNQHSAINGGLGSVVEQLNGKTMKGGLFRCDLKTDALHCWCEAKQTAPAGGLLRKVFVGAGGKELHYDEAFSSAYYLEMSEEQWGRLQCIGIHPCYRRFYSMSCKLLCSFSQFSFEGIITIAEERFKKMKLINPGKVFITMLLDAVESAPRLKSLSGKWWEAPVSARLTNSRKLASSKSKLNH